MKLGEQVSIRTDAFARSIKHAVPEMEELQGTGGVITEIIEHKSDTLYRVRDYYWEDCQLQSKEEFSVVEDHRNKLINELTLLYLQKNKDYGNSVQVTFSVFGETSTLTRISDKINRLKSLRTKEAEVEESIDDTIRDLINYWGIHKSMESEAKLATFVNTITYFIKFPNYELSNIQDLVSKKILDNDTRTYIATHIEQLVD